MIIKWVITYFLKRLLSRYVSASLADQLIAAGISAVAEIKARGSDAIAHDENGNVRVLMPSGPDKKVTVEDILNPRDNV